MKTGRLFCVRKQNEWKWKWRQKRVKLQLDSARLRRRADVCKRIYPFLLLAASEEKWDHIDWGFEMLRLLYSEGQAQSQDALRLGSLVRQIDDVGKAECALLVMSGFVVLYRHNPQCHEDIISALAVIALYAYRSKRNALLAKSGDYLCRIALEQEAVTDETIRAVKQVGMLAIRRKDDALFREIMSRIMTVFFVKAGDRMMLTSLLVDWLERILHQDAETCYNAWRDCFVDSISQRRWTSRAMLELLESCRSLAGLASINPYASTMRSFLTDILCYAEAEESADVQITAVQIVGMAMRNAVRSYSSALAKPYIIPLVRFGGSLAWRQIRFPILYETGEGRVLKAVWQVFMLLEKEMEEYDYQGEQDALCTIYELYRTESPISERDNLFWRSLFAYRKEMYGNHIPRKAGRLTKRERTNLLRT